MNDQQLKMFKENIRLARYFAGQYRKKYPDLYERHADLINAIADEALMRACIDYDGGHESGAGLASYYRVAFYRAVQAEVLEEESQTISIPTATRKKYRKYDPESPVNETHAKMVAATTGRVSLDALGYHVGITPPDEIDEEGDEECRRQARLVEEAMPRLSPRQARVVRALIESRSMDEVSDRLGMDKWEIESRIIPSVAKACRMALSGRPSRRNLRASVLRTIAESNDPISDRSIAKKIGVDRQTASVSACRLKERGLVRRSGVDKVGEKCWTLTPEGAAAVSSQGGAGCVITGRK